MISIKFCGLKTQEDIDVASSLDIDFLGFVFYAKSPRNITVDTFSKLNIQNAKNIVAVFYKPSLELIQSVINSNRIDFLQIHNISALDLQNIKNITKKKIIAVIHSEEFSKEDLDDFSFAEYLLFDGIKAGSGTARDFSFAEKIPFLTKKPFFLSGGININNVFNAVKYTNLIDLSSGIEEVRGVKSHQLMREFIKIKQELTSNFIQL